MFLLPVRTRTCHALRLIKKAPQTLIRMFILILVKTPLHYVCTCVCSQTGYGTALPMLSFARRRLVLTEANSTHVRFVLTLQL